MQFFQLETGMLLETTLQLHKVFNPGVHKLHLFISHLTVGRLYKQHIF